MKKPLAIFILILILLYLGIRYFIQNVAPYSIIKPSFSELLNNHYYQPQIWNLKYDILNIQSFDSLRLKVWYIYSNRPESNINIILLHGISGSKESNIKLAYFLSKNGYKVILPDLRAHGLSEGKYCTFGYYEKQDVASIIDFIIEKNTEKQIFGIWGTSLGGAIAMQSLEFDKRLKFGILESTFATLEESVRDYMERIYGLTYKSLSDDILENAARIGSFEIKKVSPEESAKHVYQPVLLIHGQNDVRINIKYGRRIFTTLKSRKKSFLTVKYADHTDVAEIAGTDYYFKILDFIKSCTANKLK